MTLSIAKPFVSIFKKSHKSKKDNDNVNNNVNSKNGTIQQNSNYLTVNQQQRSYNDKEKIEEVYTVLYQILDESSCRGAEHYKAKYEERKIKINEEGVFLYDQDILISQWGFSLIKEFSLDENWSDWIVILRDGTKHFFKSYESIQIHLKINDIIRKLVSQIPSSSSQSLSY